MKRKIYLLGELFFFFTSYVSYTQDAQFFALGAVFKKEFPPHTHHLNPIHGFVSVKTDFIANIVRYNPSSQISLSLASPYQQNCPSTMFYLHPDDQHLRASTHKPIVLFNACSVAQLAYSLSKKEDLNVDDMQAIGETYRGKKYQSRLEEFRNKTITLFKADKRIGWYALLTFLYLYSEDPYRASVDYCKSLADHYAIPFDKKNFLQDIEKQPYSKNQELMKKLLECRTGYGLPSPIRYSIKPIAYKNYQPVQDCCESALREIASIYYHLNGKSSSLRSSLQNYFTTHPSINNEDLQARKDWFALLCEQGFKYKQACYGVVSHIENFRYGLAHLLQNAKIDTNNFWESWAAAISTGTISWKLHQKKVHAPDRADISWDITSQEDQCCYRITLHIRPRHAWVTRDCSYKDLLPNKLCLSSQPSAVMTELLVYAPWLSDSYFVRNPDLLYALPSSNDGERYQIVKKAVDLFKFFKKYKKTSLSPLIEKIIPAIEDPDLIRKALKYCMGPEIWSCLPARFIEKQKERLNDENLIAFNQDLCRFDPQQTMQEK